MSSFKKTLLCSKTASLRSHVRNTKSVENKDRSGNPPPTTGWWLEVLLCDKLRILTATMVLQKTCFKRRVPTKERLFHLGLSFSCFLSTWPTVEVESCSGWGHHLGMLPEKCIPRYLLLFPERSIRFAKSVWHHVELQGEGLLYQAS